MSAGRVGHGSGEGQVINLKDCQGGKGPGPGSQLLQLLPRRPAVSTGSCPEAHASLATSR
jgi:hypothetical protein